MNSPKDTWQPSFLRRPTAAILADAPMGVILEKLGAIEDVRILGRFRVAEKQTESHTG
jgi:hypothetical protein